MPRACAPTLLRGPNRRNWRELRAYDYRGLIVEASLAELADGYH
jgi:hypothetical protein